jgi:outer membrane receptor protein involved in Fe transport
VGTFDNGKVKPKQSKGDGFTYRFNGTWKPRDGLMFYATWSKGFRPGGINRQPGLAPYNPDFLINYELGWKTTFGPFRWNGAFYHQLWKKFQFSFLGESSLTVVQNGRDARINGVETDVNYTRGGLTLNAAAAYTDAKTKQNICAVAADQTPDCTDPGDEITAPTGTRLPVTPKFKVTGTARYAWNMGPGRAHVQAGVVHQGSARSALRVADNDLTGTLKGYTLVDLFAGYDWNKYNLELFATNVFDVRNQLSRFVVCGLCTNIHIVPGQPRTIGIRAGVKF